MEVAKIPHNSILSNSKILKPNYHLNYGKKRIEQAIRIGNPFQSLGDMTADVYTGGIFKRVFIEGEESGIPYISAQHMMNSNPLEVAKIISRKYTPRQEDMTLHNTQILVSCAGTVGNVRLIGNNLEGVIGSQDIIRVIADNDKFPFGYIYAYLASPTAYNYIQSYIYGSVVPRIEPNTLSKLPIPILTDELINEIHENIIFSLDSRNKAIEHLDKSVSLIESELPSLEIESIYPLKLSSINDYRKRFESTLQINTINQYYSDIEKKGFVLKRISEISEQVFTPGIFKRIKVQKSARSVPYTGGAELLNFRPKLNTYLSRNTKNLSDYILKEGYIAIQDSGSLQSMGYVSIIPKYLNGVAATNNLVRVVPSSEENYNNYIFAYLKTKQANTLLKRLAYGTGQLHIDTNIVSELKVPIIDHFLNNVNENIAAYMRHIEAAYDAENHAINLIEKEIESWQK